jgi:rod shape-determining protein MreD
MSNVLPIATTLLAALLSIEPLHIGGYAALTPSFTLMATFHWAIYRPDLLPALSLFVIGTVQDLLAGGLPGETPVILCRAVVLRDPSYYAGRQFTVIWAAFTLVAFAAAAILWALHSLLSSGQFLDLRGPVFTAVLTIAVFPIVSFLLARSRRALIGAD